MLKLREDLSVNKFLNLNIYGVSSRGSYIGYIMDDFIVEWEVEVFNTWWSLLIKIKRIIRLMVMFNDGYN
jgi:hypothetical protein